MVGVLEKVQTSEHDAPTYCDIMVYTCRWCMGGRSAREGTDE